jgi:hypothetical protein
MWLQNRRYIEKFNNQIVFMTSDLTYVQTSVLA